MKPSCHDIACPCCTASSAPFEQYGERLSCAYRDESSTLWECESCGHLFFAPLPSEQALDIFYKYEYAGAAQNYYTVEKNYAPEKNAPLVALIKRVMREHVRADISGLRIHDVGCAFGGLVHALRAEGFDATGSDLNCDAISVGQDRGNAHLFAGPVAEYIRQCGRRYHAFWLSHVLEHLPDPMFLLKRLHGSLEQDGVLVIHIPSGLFAPSRRDSMQRNGWFGYPMHPHMFTPRSICKALEASGFRVVDLECTTHEEQLDWLLETLVGVRGEEIPRADAFVAALAANYLGRELRVVACRHDSPAKTSFEIAQLPRLVRPWSRSLQPQPLEARTTGAPIRCARAMKKIIGASLRRLSPSLHAHCRRLYHKIRKGS
jgi:SAM-dependent methyltransferase